MYLVRNIVKSEPLTQNGLFDTEKFGWWHTQLAPEAFRRLSNGMEGIFRASILKLMPAEEIGEVFDPQIGRPTKERMETLPEILLADTAYGSQAYVEMSAQMGVELVSPASGNVEKPNGNTLTELRAGEFSAAEDKKAELKRRRAEQETPEWKRQYAKRSGVEGGHEALDRKTGIKKLKVRGIKVRAQKVDFALLLNA